MNKNIGYRPTWAEINLDNLEYNFSQVRSLVSRDTKIMVCVKADAYGHGLIPVSARLESSGVDYLGVASIDEGIKLRQAKIKVPVLTLGMALKKNIAPLFEYNLIPTVCTEDLAAALNNKGRSLRRRISIHVKIDTGMGRLGVMHDEAERLIKRIKKFKFIDIEGIFTHLAFADADRKFTLRQITLFERLIDKLERSGIHIPLAHAANSMGVIDYKKSHFNMVRPGLVIYGLYPRKSLSLKLKPVLSLKTRVVFFKKVPRGYGISYGHIYYTKNDTTIAVLPIGYGDGYPRNLSNVSPVLIKGKRFYISGRVCMDQMMVDVGELPLKIGDEVVLIGSQGRNKITVEELAKLGGTIPYEIVCGLGVRIPRVYVLTQGLYQI